MEIKEMKQAVLDFALRAFDEKLMAGTSGNVSAFSRQHGLMAITPSGYDYRKMTVDDIMVIDLDGNIKEGSHAPSSEWRMHAEIYKGIESIDAIVHTHSPYATAFAVLNEPIPIILIEMVVFLGGEIRTAEFATPGTAEVGVNAVKALHNRKACLLNNHGVVGVGKTLDEAYIGAVYAEDSAKICYMARSMGTPKLVPQWGEDELRKMYSIPR